MERTLSVNYPVQNRQNKGVLLNMFEKHHGRKIQNCTSILEARRDRWIECTERNLMNVFVFLTYSIIHPYFALVQGVLCIYMLSSYCGCNIAYVLKKQFHYCTLLQQARWIEGTERNLKTLVLNDSMKVFNDTHLKI